MISLVLHSEKKKRCNEIGNEALASGADEHQTVEGCVAQDEPRKSDTLDSHQREEHPAEEDIFVFSYYQTAKPHFQVRAADVAPMNVGLSVKESSL